MSIYLLRDGQERGPYEESVIAGWLGSKECSPEDLAWKEGMSDWQPLITFNLSPPSLPRSVTASTTWSQKIFPAAVGALVFAPFSALTLIMPCLWPFFFLAGASAGGYVAVVVYSLKIKPAGARAVPVLRECLITGALAGVLAGSLVFIGEMVVEMVSAAGANPSKPFVFHFPGVVTLLIQYTITVFGATFGGFGGIRRLAAAIAGPGAP